MSCAIRACSLGRKFGRATALDSLDLEVPEGAIYALVGPRGSGKTTCIRVLLNVLPPSAGQSEVLGVDSRHLTPQHFARIGYLAEAQDMPGRMTVGYFLRFLSGFYPTWDAAIAADLVRQFQLQLDRKLAALSPATRMKAALVSTLAYRPKLMLLDEPFRGLDRLSHRELLQTLLGRGGGATILVSAEDPGEIEAFASHIGCLEGGRLRHSEPLDVLRGRVREVVLTYPDAPRLPDDWPAAWIDRQRGATTVRFMETRFDAERTPDEARRRLPGFHDLAVNPLPLKVILAALARTWPSLP